MALKRKISKETFEGLSDDLKKEYKAEGDGYVLDVDGIVSEDDIAELRRAKEREAQAAKDANKELKTLKQRLESLEGDDARKRGDIDALERSWKEKYENRENELTATIESKDQFIRRTLVDATAENLATKISTAPKLMSKAIRDRLTVEMNGDTPALRVLDKDGKASAMSVEDLEKEIVADKEFSAIIIGSKASGGGAGTDPKRGQSGAGPSEPVDIAKLTPQQHAERLRQQKEQRA